MKGTGRSAGGYTYLLDLKFDLMVVIQTARLPFPMVKSGKMRNRIGYGIDLGTTNSAIARIEDGESVIKKSEFQKDTTASAIAYGRKGNADWRFDYESIKSDRLASTKGNVPIKHI